MTGRAGRWRHIAVLLVSTSLVALGTSGIAPVLAQSASANAAVRISIPAQPLPAAIDAFIAQTGWQVSYPSAAAAGQTSVAVSGVLAPEQALRQLVGASSLSVRVSGPGAAALVAGGDVAAVAAEPGSYVLDTIYVTGEKVGRDYFSTYTSIGVVSADDIVNHNIADLEDAFETVANARAMPSGRGDSNITIRGMNAEGVTEPSRNAPIISMLVDGSFQNLEAMRRGARGLWDVEQVEVLRGPQSTLQGRNSLGGTVIIETKDPTWEREILVEGQLGTNALRSGAVAISGPIIDNQVAFRLSGQIARENNGITYTDPSVAALGESELEDFRGKLLIEPDAVPGLSALFTISRTHDRPSWNAVTGPDFFARTFDPTVSDSTEFRDTTVNRYIADISYDLSPDWTVRSLTALSTTETTITSTTPIFSPIPAVLNRDDLRLGSDFTQDLTFSYEAPDARLSALFGLFAGHSVMDADSSIIANPDPMLPLPPQIVIQDLRSITTTTSYAAYADLRYEVVDGITLLGGGRLLHDTVVADFQGVGIDAFLNPVSLNENNSATNLEFLPKLGVAFDVTDNQTVALTATKGYRTGFSEAVAGTATVNLVQPEYLWAYEAAYRSRWLDDRLELNGNLFYYDYSNQQVVVQNPLAPGQTYTQNSAKSSSYGAEVEARYRPTDELSLFGSLGLMRTQFESAVVNIGGVDVDISGNRFPQAPAVTASIGALWQHESGFFAGARIAYTDGFYSAGDVRNTPSRYIDAFTTVDAQIGYETENAKVTLFADNLFDAQYLTSIDASGVEATIGPGRTIGVKASAKF